MKRFFLLLASFTSLSLAAQINGTLGDQDPISPKVGYPKHSAVDTPHFQSAPGEGLTAGANAGRYCGAMVGNRIAVVYKGKTIVDNRTFPNGTVVFKDGTVVLSTGERKKLKDGDCIDGNGMPIQ